MEELLREALGELRLLRRAVERLAANTSAGETSSSAASGVRAGAARGSEPIGTPVASIESNDNKKNHRSIDRSIESFAWDDVTKVGTDDVECEAVRFRCRELERRRTRTGEWVGVIRLKDARYREDAALLVTAAVIARRIDHLCGDQRGSEWLDHAVEAVRIRRPDNSVAYFTTCLQRGLTIVDPALDSVGAAMTWVRLLRAVAPHIPQRWLENPRPAGRENREKTA